MEKKPVTTETMREMAKKAIRYLHGRGLFYDVEIYAGGMQYASACQPGLAKDGSVPGMELWSGRCHTCPSEYANMETLTMLFEGPLYHAIHYNEGYGGRCLAELNEIFAEYGLYAELGHAWSMACYEID